jgi:hypothetical protein
MNRPGVDLRRAAKAIARFGTESLTGSIKPEHCRSLAREKLRNVRHSQRLEVPLDFGQPAAVHRRDSRSRSDLLAAASPLGGHRCNTEHYENCCHAAQANADSPLSLRTVASDGLYRSEFGFAHRRGRRVIEVQEHGLPPKAIYSRDRSGAERTPGTHAS